MFLHTEAAKTSGWLGGWGLEPIVISSAYLALLAVFVGFYDPSAMYNFLFTIVVTSPFWLPFFMLTIFWVGWMHYVRFMFYFSYKNVLLEVQLPPEVEKSPLAMELFLTMFSNNGGETTVFNRVWEGKYRAIWSLEIASNEGRIGFYIRTRDAFRNLIEARLYGQFPEAKIFEVDDYVNKVPLDLKGYALWGNEYAKGKPQALPIRTYVDFGMDKDPKEEYKTDPLAHILELIGQIGKDEYFWIQIIFKARKYDEWYGLYQHHTDATKKNDSYAGKAKEEIKKIMAGAAARAKEVITENDITEGKTSLLTDGEKRRIDAIERAMSKPLFECGIRTLYIAKEEKFSGINIGQAINLFAPYKGSNDYNSISVARGMAFFDYAWQDFKNFRRNKIIKQLFFNYRHRAYFYVPYDQVPVFLNTEELASLWHFPGSSIKTPGLSRVPSRRAEAPVNLPTGQ